MDTVQEKNIKQFLSNTELFYSLVKSTVDKNPEELIELMKCQHTLNQGVLTDLGVSFDKTVQMRKLNDRIRFLENESGKVSENTFKSLNQFIAYQTKELNLILKEKGLSGNVQLQMGETLSCEFKLYSVYENTTSSYSRNEDELNDQKEKHAHKLEKYKSNFDVKLIKPVYSGLPCYAVLYTDRNIEVLKGLFVDYFNEELYDLHYELNTHGDGFEITKISFKVMFLDTHKAFNEAFTR